MDNSNTNEILDNIDHQPTLDNQNIFIRIFRFFNQCSYYAINTRKGILNIDTERIRFGTWALVSGFIFFPVSIFLSLIPYEPIAMLGFFIFPITMLFITVVQIIFFLFGQSKVLWKICKHWFVMKYPTFSSEKKRFLYAFYFYLILMGIALTPIVLYFVLEYIGYYYTA